MKEAAGYALACDVTLYCLQRLAVEDRKKLFESSYVSLMLEGFS